MVRNLFRAGGVAERFGVPAAVLCIVLTWLSGIGYWVAHCLVSPLLAQQMQTSAAMQGAVNKFADAATAQTELINRLVSSVERQEAMHRDDHDAIPKLLTGVERLLAAPTPAAKPPGG
jgi:hypothetical protein